MKRIFILLFVLCALTVSQYADAQTMYDLRKEAKSKAEVFVFYDDFFRLGWIDTTGSSVSLGAGMWIDTRTSAGSGTTTMFIDSAAGGILKVVNAGDDNDGFQRQWHVPITDCDTTGSGAHLFEIKCKLGAARTSDFYAGLTGLDTDLTDGTDDGVYFYKPDDVDSMYCISVRNGVGDTTIVDSAVSDSTWITLEITFNGRNRVEYRIDGELEATVTTVAYIPADESLTPGFGYWNGSAVARVSWWDYIYLSQKR